MSCPVFGPPAAAKSAGLLIVLSGTEEARRTVKSYIVPTLGKGVIDCGEETSKGALLKILGNNCILGTIELLSESFTLAEKTGFDTDIFYEFIRECFLFFLLLLLSLIDLEELPICFLKIWKRTFNSFVQQSPNIHALFPLPN